MKDLQHNAALWLAVTLASTLTACGGGGGGSSTTPPPATTYTLTVNSLSPATGVAMMVSPADTNGATSGATSLTRTYNSGTVVIVTAPASSGNNTFQSWSGCTTASKETCNVSMTANTTVTATYAAPKITPTVTVSPASFAITTAQSLSVAIAVSGGTGNPVVTGSVTLSSGAYSSAATTLAGGAATVNVPAGSLAVGSDTLTASYTPDSAGSSAYNPASGTSPVVTVTAVETAIAIDQASIGPAVTDKLLGMNMAAWYDPTTSAIVPAFQLAGIQAVRWPGGSWSDDYHWATNTMCGNFPNSNATFTNFVNQLVLPGNFDVALTANYGSNSTCNGPGQPAEAAAWITQAKAINAHVTHITVGNEEYGSWEDDLHTAKNDAATYAIAVGTASTSAGYFAQIKAADSSALVGVDVNPGNSPAWDPIVLGNSQYDFVEYHYIRKPPAARATPTWCSRQPGDLQRRSTPSRPNLRPRASPTHQSMSAR